MRTRWRVDDAGSGSIAARAGQSAAAAPAPRGKANGSRDLARPKAATVGHMLPCVHTHWRPTRRCRAPERGNRSHTTNHPEIVAHMNFTALNTTKQLFLNLNHLHHAQVAHETTKLSYNTTPLLNPISHNKLLNIAVSNCWQT